MTGPLPLTLSFSAFPIQIQRPIRLNFLSQISSSKGGVSTLTRPSFDVYIATLPGERLVIVGPSG